MEPQAAPLHPGPETLQFTTRLGFESGAGVIVAVYATVAPVFTEAGPLTVSAKLLVTVIAALAAFEESATLRAVTVTLGGEIIICGAVYSPAFEIVPTLGFPPGTPFTLQLTPGLVVLVTVAVNC